MKNNTDTPQGLICPECGRQLSWNNGAVRCSYRHCPILGHDQAETDLEITALQTTLEEVKK